jgi:hypothetical protein
MQRASAGEACYFAIFPFGASTRTTSYFVAQFGHSNDVDWELGIALGLWAGPLKRSVRSKDQTRIKGISPFHLTS